MSTPDRAEIRRRVAADLQRLCATRPMTIAADDGAALIAAELIIRDVLGDPTVNEQRNLPTVVSILKAETDHDRMDCCDDDPRKVWVVVGAWSGRRAVLTHAAPFLTAAGTDDLAALEDAHFMCRLDLSNPPPFEHEGGERLEWPDLRLAPPMSEVYARLGITTPEEFRP